MPHEPLHDWHEDADLRLADAIVQQLDGSCMLTHFVVVAEVLDEDGDRRLVFNSARDDRQTDSLGLASWAMAFLNSQVSAEYRRSIGADPPLDDE